MYKITNIETLGTEYSVADNKGNVIKNVQIIPHTEILDAALGEYDETFDSLSSYITESIAVLAGNENIRPLSIYWHATEDEDVVLADIIEYAVKYDYDVIILEHIDPSLH